MPRDGAPVPRTATADEAIGLVRQQAAAMDNVYYVYVVDEGERLLGVLSLRELIVAEPSTPIGRVMHRELIRGLLDDSHEQVARLIAKTNVLALPIVAAFARLRCIVTIAHSMDLSRQYAWM